NEKDNAISTE
ncbi:semenogelin-2 precursor, partial [Daubentonia madagascariensis]